MSDICFLKSTHYCKIAWRENKSNLIPSDALDIFKTTELEKVHLETIGFICCGLIIRQ